MNIGIVGLGHLGKIHLKLLKENTNFSVTAMYDINNHLLSDLSHQYKVYPAKDYEDLLNKSDAVLIVTPTPTHFNLAKKALQAGKHLFIEKPATQLLEETLQLLKLAREAEAIVQIGHVERYNPAYLSVKDKIKSPYLINSARLANYNVRGTDVSVVKDLMIHDIDVVLNLVQSQVKRISAKGEKIVSQSADIAHAVIEFENGTLVNLTANRVAPKNERKMDVFEQKHQYHIDFLNKYSEIYSASINEQKEFILTNTKMEVKENNAIKNELQDFYLSIQNHQTVSVSLKDAALALEVAEKIEVQIQ